MTKVLGHKKVETPLNKRPGFQLLGDAESRSPLKQRFHIPPFDVIDTRAGEWQSRKRIWKSLGIDSGDGRADDLLFAKDMFKDSAKYGDQWANRKLETTSIFDPVLCELCYTWFCPVGGRILDPFAGGSVRGMVAAHMGLDYFGVDLSEKQVTANIKQVKSVKNGIVPMWVVGNSLNLPKLVGGKFDMMFTCPPYHDLEKYSDDPADLSNVTYPVFVDMIREIAVHVEALLKPSRFACVVIQDVRGENGNYRGMITDFIRAFRRAGMSFYNEAILVQPVGTACLRAARQFKAGRKLVKTHGRLLVFLKGESPKLGKNEGLWTA